MLPLLPSVPDFSGLAGFLTQRSGALTTDAGLFLQVGLHTMGLGIEMATQRDAGFRYRCVLDIFSHIFAHSFPAVQKPGLPVFTGFVFTVLGIPYTGTSCTRTNQSKRLLSDCGIGHTDVAPVQKPLCRKGCTNLRGFPPGYPGKRGDSQSGLVCVCGFCSKRSASTRVTSLNVLEYVHIIVLEPVLVKGR